MLQYLRRSLNLDTCLHVVEVAAEHSLKETVHCSVGVLADLVLDRGYTVNLSTSHAQIGDCRDVSDAQFLAQYAHLS